MHAVERGQGCGARGCSKEKRRVLMSRQRYKGAGFVYDVKVV